MARSLMKVAATSAIFAGASACQAQGLVAPDALAPGQAQAPAPTRTAPEDLPDLLIERPESLPQWVVLELKGDSQAARRLAARNEREQAEKDLRAIRFKYLRGSEEMRQIGLSKVREYAGEADLYPVLIEIFRREDDAVRHAVLDMIMEQHSSEGDITLAWTAIHDRDPWMRKQAEDRLHARVDEAGKVDQGIVYIMAHRLLEGDERYMGRIAGMADNFSIVQLVPHLIHAQVGGGGGGGNRVGDKGWIVIGRQVGFVSDLQPVVADSAVGFDPTIDVVTEGVLLRIQDGVVTTHRYEIHVPLTRLGSRAIGYDLADRAFGFDQEKWWTWYHDEFVPAMAAKDSGTETAGG